MRYSFKEFHPSIIFSYYLCVICMTMLYRHPAFIFLGVLLALLQYVGYVGKKAIVMFFAMGIPVWGLSVLVNVLFVHEGATILMYYPNGNPLTLEAIWFGVVAGGMIVATILWFGSFSILMTSEKWIHIFGGVMPTIGLIFSMTLRFIPMYQRRWREIWDANMLSNCKKNRVKNILRCFGITFTWALEHGVDTADSMTARGYGIGRRSHYKRYKIDARDGVFFAVLLFVIVAYGFGIWNKWIYYEAYPLMDLKWNGYTYWVLLGFTVLGLVPDILEILDKIDEKKGYYVSD